MHAHTLINSQFLDPCPYIMKKKVTGLKLKTETEVTQSFPTLCDPVDCSLPSSMGFSREEYWSGLPFPSPGDLPDPGIEPRFPALEVDALTSEPPGKVIGLETKSKT